MLGTYRTWAAPRARAAAGPRRARACAGQSDPVLAGLSAPEVALLSECSGLQPVEPLVTAVYHATEGNPFFLTEVVRLLAQEESQAAIRGPQPAMAIPQGVRAAVERRLHALGGVSAGADPGGRDGPRGGAGSSKPPGRCCVPPDRRAAARVLEEAVAARSSPNPPGRSAAIVLPMP